MAIDGGAVNGGRTRFYQLGRQCSLTIEGKAIFGASDVLVSETVTEVDATGFNHQVVSTVVTQRTYEITVSIPDITDAFELYEYRWANADGFLVPAILNVSLFGGVVGFFDEKFTIHNVDDEQPLDGVVVPRFTLKQWGHR
jgi:hypothetical protein